MNSEMREKAFNSESAMIALTMHNTPKADFKDLVDAWWKTAEILEARPPADEIKVNCHIHVFEKILTQCGWTVEEWNDYIAAEEQGLR